MFKTPTISRREFTTAVAAGFGAALLPSVPSASSAQARKLRIGCTSLIWGALPRSPDNLAPAVKDMASLGFHGFETFAAILEEWDKRGTIGELLATNKIPLDLGRTRTMQVDRSGGAEGRDRQAHALGDVVKKHGGRFVVLAPNGVKREGYNFQEHRANIVAALNDYAMAVNDLGLGAGLHQHTGTAVETRDETYAVMEAANTKHLKFAPDVGQLQKGGAERGPGRQGLPADHRAHAPQGLQRRRALRRLLPARSGQGRSEGHPRHGRGRESDGEHHGGARRLGRTCRTRRSKPRRSARRICEKLGYAFRT